MGQINLFLKQTVLFQIYRAKIKDTKSELLYMYRASQLIYTLILHSKKSATPLINKISHNVFHLHCIYYYPKHGEQFNVGTRIK